MQCHQPRSGNADARRCWRGQTCPGGSVRECGARMSLLHAFDTLENQEIDAVIVERELQRTKAVPLSYMDFVCREFPPRKLLLDPWLAEKAIAMIHGWRGIGKSFLIHGSAWAVATGGGFLTWKSSEARRVLLIDGEMPADALKERLLKVINNSEKQPPMPDTLSILAADLAPEGLPDLSDPKAQEYYAEA